MGASYARFDARLNRQPAERDAMPTDFCRLTAAAVLLASLSPAAANAAEPAAAPDAIAAEPDPMADGRLDVGELAPQLQISNWVKGESFDKFEQGHVYVVEFWATWCGPCIVGIPHLTKTQQAYAGDVTLIGVTGPGGQTLEDVSAFVTQQGDKMDYTVAYDDQRRPYTAYMQATQQNGIPHAFIVDKNGRLAWHGHPASNEFDTTLAAIVADTFDLEAAAKADREQAVAQRAQFEQQQRRTEVMQRAQPLFEAWADAVENERLDDALAVADDIVAVDPEIMSNAALWKFETLLIELERTDEAYAYAKQVGDDIYAESPIVLTYLARIIVDTVGLENPNLELADKLASKAAALTDEEDAIVLEVLAFVKAERGDYAEAVRLQKLAMDLAEDPMQRADYEAFLEDYQSALDDE
ncbi:MAG: TlpA disulfide reductase family protein [Planctomycetota bacterium]